MRASFVGLLLAALLLAVLGAELFGCRRPGGPGVAAGRAVPLPMTAPVRGIWVSRFEYRQAADVGTIIRNCAELGCNTVYWQVRGAGTVCYPSKLEPWSREFGFGDPGFDPLALAVAEAHRHGLRLEAWVNVLPGWKGEQPPPMPGQLWNAHPDWFLRDARGQRQPLGGFYLILNPCLPEVRRHIVSVIEEIVTRYDVDGVHLDYVRYAWDTNPDAEKKYLRDRRTLDLYERQTHKRPDDDAVAWRDWRANQLTRLVAQIRTMLDRRRPGATLTAAVVRDPYRAYEQYFQNGVSWLRAGLVDALFPMAYTDRLDEFVRDVSAYRRLLGRWRVVPGLGIYKQDGEAMRRQLAQCAEWGGDFALFSYGALHAAHQGREDRSAAGPKPEAAGRTRRAVLRDSLRR